MLQISNNILALVPTLCRESELFFVKRHCLGIEMGLKKNIKNTNDKCITMLIKSKANTRYSAKPAAQIM
jgi:hypothetical protein